VGDQVKFSLTEELVVQRGDGTDTDCGAAFVAWTPKGFRPGGVIAEAVQVTGTVTAIDTTHRTATLQVADGTTRTFPVRRDVDLSQGMVGDKVAFQVTEMIAFSLENPDPRSATGTHQITARNTNHYEEQAAPHLPDRRPGVTPRA